MPVNGPGVFSQSSWAAPANDGMPVDQDMGGYGAQNPTLIYSSGGSPGSSGNPVPPTWNVTHGISSTEQALSTSEVEHGAQQGTPALTTAPVIAGCSSVQFFRWE
jgi:hypothetical protein